MLNDGHHLPIEPLWLAKCCLSTILLAFSYAFISTNGERAIVIDSIPYKISKQQFLSECGKDDTSKAVINYFFKQHKKAKKELFPTP